MVQMAKYVDVEKEFCDYCGDRDRCGSPDFFCNVKSMVAADVAPVVHGRWIVDENGVTYCGRCRIIDDYASVHNFCPNCGADMRERRIDG